MRATGSACSRSVLIEAEAFAVARPPAFPQKLPHGADVVGFSLAGLYQEHRAAGLGAPLEAPSDDLGVIVGGYPVIIANRPNHMSSPSSPALRAPNHASALSAPRRKVGTPAPARSARGTSSGKA